MVLTKTVENRKTQYCQRHKDAARRFKPEKVPRMDFLGHTRHFKMRRGASG